MACPECRGVFRIRKNESGCGVMCPQCGTRLRTGDGPLRELNANDVYSEAKILTAGESEIRDRKDAGAARKKHHAGGEQNTLHWEADKESGKTGISSMGVLTVLLVFLSLAGVVFYMWRVNIAREHAYAAQQATITEAMVLPKALDSEVKGRDDEELAAEAKEAERLGEIASAESVAEMNERIKSFLEADTVSGKARYVRDWERVLPLMKDYYEKEEISPEGYRQTSDKRKLIAGNSVISTMVRVKDFSDYPIDLEYKDGEWLVDWESWVGYSEMGLDELRRKQPSDDVLIRVAVLQDSYYNYDFGDDSKWTSFRLRFKGRFEDLWGYAETGSPQEAAIVDQFSQQKEKAMRLKIKYPTDPRNDDQVLITDVVGEGWIQFSENFKEKKK